MKTSYDEDYKQAILAARAAANHVRDIEDKMTAERAVADGPNGRYNYRKYYPLRKHMDKLANEAIGFKGFRR